MLWGCALKGIVMEIQANFKICISCGSQYTFPLFNLSIETLSSPH